MTVNNTDSKIRRLGVVDALRGFALFGIVLFHNLEHYNLFTQTDYILPGLAGVDQWVWNITQFIFAGKAYAIFSLLFGFSYYIQLKHQSDKGGDFKWRFAWRLFLLFLFGQFHAAFYSGDILVLYSVVGLILIPVRKWSDKALLVTAVVCLLQPYEWGRIIYALFNPDVDYTALNGAYYRMLVPVMTDGNFWETAKAFLTTGQIQNNLWQVENGRFFQAAALFMFGMLLGRTKMFVDSDTSRRFWKKALLCSVIAFPVLFAAKTYIPELVEQKSLLIPLKIILPSFSNFAFMAIIVSGFILLWFGRGDGYGFQRIFVPYGRMSLTNYITQSVIGGFIYLGWGLGMYYYLGFTLSLCTGIAIFTLQVLFSRRWLDRHRQGPLEYLWRKGTWLLK